MSDAKRFTSELFFRAAQETWRNREGKLGEIVTVAPDFSGVRIVPIGGLPQGTCLLHNYDGVGTKVDVAERTGRHDTIAYDLFAMVCDDAAVRGAEPVLVGSVLDTNTLSTGDDLLDDMILDCLGELVRGYVAAAREANVVVINGEVAELGHRVHGVGPFNYNWCAGVISFAHESRIITGEKIRPGDYLVGLREEGMRANGLTLARRILSDTHGEGWHDVPASGTTLGALALYPSRIYTRIIVDMTGGFDGVPRAIVHGAAHITGGGIPEKLGRLLAPTGFGADIIDPFSPCALMGYCQEQGGLSDEECYRAWNMGQGMILATPSPDDVIAVARSHQIDAKVIGEISAAPGIRIRSQGLENALLSFHLSQ